MPTNQCNHTAQIQNHAPQQEHTINAMYTPVMTIPQNTQTPSPSVLPNITSLLHLPPPPLYSNSVVHPQIANPLSKPRGKTMTNATHGNQFVTSKKLSPSRSNSYHHTMRSTSFKQNQNREKHHENQYQKTHSIHTQSPQRHYQVPSPSHYNQRRVKRTKTLATPYSYKDNIVIRDPDTSSDTQEQSNSTVKTKMISNSAGKNMENQSDNVQENGHLKRTTSWSPSFKPDALNTNDTNHDACVAITPVIVPHNDTDPNDNALPNESYDTSTVHKDGESQSTAQCMSEPATTPCNKDQCNSTDYQSKNNTTVKTKLYHNTVNSAISTPSPIHTHLTNSTVVVPVGCNMPEPVPGNVYNNDVTTLQATSNANVNVNANANPKDTNANIAKYASMSTHTSVNTCTELSPHCVNLPETAGEIKSSAKKLSECIPCDYNMPEPTLCYPVACNDQTNSQTTPDDGVTLQKTGHIAACQNPDDHSSKSKNL